MTRGPRAPGPGRGPWCCLPDMSAEVRLRRLQQLVLDPGFLGLEPLLDLLLGVHQELGASDLAQDKYVADFLQWGECLSAWTPPDWGTVGAGQRPEMGLGPGADGWGQDGRATASHSGALNLVRGPRETCPYPCATLAGQAGVSEGQGSRDSEPGLGSHGSLRWTQLPVWSLRAPSPKSRPKDMQGALYFGTPPTEMGPVAHRPGFPEQGSAGRGEADGQVFGASLPSWPNRCPGSGRVR